MKQCDAVTNPRDTPTRRIQCVMEAGHPPIGPDFEHNYGGVGPYTPNRATSTRREGPSASKDPVPVTGVWLRKSPDHYVGEIEVLVEVDGKWRKVIACPNPHDGPISHIAETGGILKAPLDDLPDAPPPNGGR